MSDFESRLSAMLHDATPEPPRELDPNAIVGNQPKRRRTRLLAPLAAVVVVALIAVVLALGGPDRHRNTSAPPAGTQSNPPPVTTDPNALYGVTWTVTDIHGLDGAADTIPAVAITFTFVHQGEGETAIISGPDCSAAIATITPGQVVFTQPFVSDLMTNCGSGPTVDEANFLFGKVLTGTTRWQITGNTLTITNASGSADLSNGRADTPTPTLGANSTETSLVAVQLITSGGPAGTPTHAVSGTINISGPGLHRTINVGSNGYYSTRLTAGTYTFTGHSPSYNSGQGLCHAAEPITVHPPTTVQGVYVVCSEK